MIDQEQRDDCKYSQDSTSNSTYANAALVGNGCRLKCNGVQPQKCRCAECAHVFHRIQRGFLERTHLRHRAYWTLVLGGDPLAGLIDTLHDAFGAAMKAVTTRDIHGCFAHCYYAMTSGHRSRS